MWVLRWTWRIYNKWSVHKCWRLLWLRHEIMCINYFYLWIDTAPPMMLLMSWNFNKIVKISAIKILGELTSVTHHQGWRNMILIYIGTFIFDWRVSILWGNDDSLCNVGSLCSNGVIYSKSRLLAVIIVLTVLTILTVLWKMADFIKMEEYWNITDFAYFALMVAHGFSSIELLINT